MRYIEEYKAQLRKIMETLSEKNTCYLDASKNYCYGYVITPRGSVLYVQTSPCCGWELHYQYRRSKKAGGGCQIFAAHDTVTQADIDDAEKTGPFLARKYGAEIYQSVEQWEKDCWNFDKLERITQ